MTKNALAASMKKLMRQRPFENYPICLCRGWRDSRVAGEQPHLPGLLHERIAFVLYPVVAHGIFQGMLECFHLESFVRMESRGCKKVRLCSVLDEKIRFEINNSYHLFHFSFFFSNFATANDIT